MKNNLNVINLYFILNNLLLKDRDVVGFVIEKFVC